MITMRLIVFFIAFIFPLQVYGLDLTLDCRGQQGTWWEKMGNVGSTEIKTRAENPGNVIVKISDNLCIFEWGQVTGKFNLIASNNEKILCGKSKDESNSKNYIKRITEWSISINRLNGKMIYLYNFENLSRENFVLHHKSNKTFECQKASNKF